MNSKMIPASVLFTILGISAYASNQQTHREVCGFEIGDQSLPKDLAAASYNFSANVQLKRAWDVSGEVSYLYWYSRQEGMDVAIPGLFSSGTVNFVSSSHAVYFQDAKYTSGFKIGLGSDLTSDQWNIHFDYTYLRPDMHSSVSTVSPIGAILTSWYAQTSSGQALTAASVSSHWKLGLDWIDATLSRPYYQGRKWSVTPFAGLRTSLIRQKMHVVINDVLNTAPNGAIASNNWSRSWGMGPRAGIASQWIAGYGLRFQGNMGGSLLFTRYSRIAHHEDPAVSPGTPIDYSIHDYDCLRPYFEMGLGLGWGRYFDNHRYHFSLSADYDFNYLWNQNMIRYLNDVEILGSGATANSLFLHGLTMTACFKF